MTLKLALQVEHFPVEKAVSKSHKEHLFASIDFDFIYSGQVLFFLVLF